MGNGVRVVVPEGWLPRAVSVFFDDTEDGLLPVSEVLLQVSALAPGPEAIALLHGLAGRVMTGPERLRVVELWQPQLAWVSGAEQTAVLAFAGPTPDPNDEGAVLADEFVPNHLAPVLHCSADHAFDRVFQARQLTEEFADLGELLRAGVLDAYRVRVILDVLTTLDTPAQAAQVQAAVLPVAAGLTPAKLRKQLRTLARQVDPGWSTTMFVKARKTRRVVFSPETDGLVGMHAYLPPVEAVAMAQHLQQAARTGPIDASDERDHDQRMADALIGAVLGSTPATRPPRWHQTSPSTCSSPPRCCSASLATWTTPDRPPRPLRRRPRASWRVTDLSRPG